MRIGCFEACACLSHCYKTAKQALCVTILKLSDIRNNPEAFQKVCIVAFSVIRVINYQCNTNYLSRLITVLDSAPAFDFYGFFKLPHYLLYPYSPDKLDEYELLDQLEVILCDNWHMGIPDQQGQNRDRLLRNFAENEIKFCLDKMVDDSIHFRSEEEMKRALHNWIEKRLESHPKPGFDPHYINLQNLKIKLKQTSWLESGSIFFLAFADVACMPDFLQGWELIDLTPYTNAIGQIPILSFVTRHAIGDWVWGALGTGFCFQFMKVAKDLWIGNLSIDEKKEAKWIMIASLAECVYCFANLQKRNANLINWLAIVAKTLGLIAFLNASRPSFFAEIK